VSSVFEVDPDSPGASAAALDAASEAVRDGGVVVFPTETVYGIAARPDDPRATSALFEAKRRPRSLTLPVLARATSDAWDMGQATAAAAALARAFWPGPLTMVVPRSALTRDWSLGDRAESIGLRVPDHRLTRSLLKRAGPLAATSANISGQHPLSDPQDLLESFGDAVTVYLVLAPGLAAPAGGASTVVDLTADEPRILREGPVGSGDIMAALAGVQTPGSVRDVTR
jgi:tRNA threonylcarbamoyl adenosine modification protein (Sua5/YciO/YrdC/YwlC family)